MAAYTGPVLDTNIDKSNAYLKKNAKPHNNNRRTGYVPVDESFSGESSGVLRGKKTYAFWSLVGVVCLLAWANMILTLVIFRVLKLGGSGLGSIELIREKATVKFTGSRSDLGRVYKPDGRLDGFLEEPLRVIGDGGSLAFSVQDSEGKVTSRISLAANGSWVAGVDAFRVVSGEGKPVFTTENPEYRMTSEGTRRLESRAVRTGRLSGQVGEKMVLRSDGFTRLRGSEGTRIEGKEMMWSADQALTLTTTNGTITLAGKRGVSLDVESIPIVGKRRSSDFHSLPVSGQYKVCVCMPQGKLFRVPVSGTHYTSQIACHNIDQTHRNSPCI